MYIDMLGMHRNLPAGPSRRLSFRYNVASFVREDIWNGIKLLNLLALRYRDVSSDREDSCEGMDFDRMLLPSSKLVRVLLRADICDGSELVSLLLFKYKLVSLLNADTCWGSGHAWNSKG